MLAKDLGNSGPLVPFGVGVCFAFEAAVDEDHTRHRRLLFPAEDLSRERRKQQEEHDEHCHIRKVGRP